jgi:hypothetical protein
MVEQVSSYAFLHSACLMGYYKGLLVPSNPDSESTPGDHTSCHLLAIQQAWAEADIRPPKDTLDRSAQLTSVVVRYNLL